MAIKKERTSKKPTYAAANATGGGSSVALVAVADPEIFVCRGEHFYTKELKCTNATLIDQNPIKWYTKYLVLLINEIQLSGA
jgi:hypothetical protein